MSIGVVSGYNQFPTGAFSPIIYSKKVLKAFRKFSVAEDITNTDYAGDIADFGDTVKIIKEPDISVRAYQRGAQLTSQDLRDDSITMVVDQANYFMFKVDDIEKKFTHINWDSLATDRAAYKLKDAFDTDILSTMTSGAQSANVLGSTTSPQVLATSPSGAQLTPLQVMARLSRYLDIANVPTDERFFAADPYFWEKISDENSKLIPVNITGDSESALRNGRITEGLIRGFKCYKSNNTVLGGTGPTGTGASNYGTLLAGHMSSTATASQIAKTESYRDPDSFADVVRGLHLYGRKVLRAESLALAYYQVVAG